MYNYLGIVNKSSAVNKCISCSFLNLFPNLNLVIAKANIIEIYNITKEGLEITPYIKVYGNIILLEKINYFNSNSSDDLFLITDDLDYSIITFDKNKNEIICVANGNTREDIGRMQDKIVYAFDIDYKYVIISAYKNIYKVIYLQQRDKNIDFTIRSDYDEMLFMFPVFIDTVLDDRERFINLISSNLSNDSIINTNVSSNKLNSVKDTNSSIYNEQNNNSNKLFKTSSSNVQNKNSTINFFHNQFGCLKVGCTNPSSDHKRLVFETFFLDQKNKQISRDNSYSLDLTNNPNISLIFSPKIGGLCIFFSNCIKYYKFSCNKIIEKECKNFSDRKFTNYCEIDKARYLISDEKGNLFILGFKKKDNNINLNYFSNSDYESSLHTYNLIFQFIGEINPPSSIAFLDNNYIFIGSEKANSQLIKTLTKPRKNNKRPLIEIIEEYDNLAPITDFLVLNKNNEEGNNTEILSVSGSQKNCCLKIIRKGTSFQADAEIFIPYVKNLNTVVYYNSDHNKNLNFNETKNSIDINFNHLNSIKDYCDHDFNHGNINENILFFIRY